ncbi:MAG: hypothetical protein ACU0DW_14035 [Shimia sp.]
MADLTRIRLHNGIWEGVIDTATMDLHAFHHDRELPNLTTSVENGETHIRLPIPTEALSDGTQTFLIKDGAGTTLATFAIHCGAPIAQDVTTELAVLRAELDLLKRAFRRHCVESASEDG